MVKHSKYIFYILVFLLPINSAKVFFSDQSFFYGYHIFYNSFWVYLTDFIFGGLIISWVFEEIKKGIIWKRITEAVKKDKLYQSVLIFWLILAISTIISRETILSAYGFLRFSQYLLMFVFVRENIVISREIRVIFWLILAISLFETGLGLGQYLNQSSLGLKYLGESALAPGMKGVAEFISEGIGNWQVISREMLVMRAYGTLPHPNVLAVVLFTAFFANLWLIYSPSPLSSPLKGEQSTSLEGRVKRSISREIFLILCLILLSTGLVLTFSRAVWLAMILVLLVLLVFLRVVKFSLFEQMRSGQRLMGGTDYKPKKVAVILLVLLVSLAMNWVLFGQQIKDRIQGRGVSVFAEQESFVDRERFASVSREMIRENPVLGVGLRNFVVRMDEYYRGGERLLPHQHQPVHNIYLLIAAETGLIGLLAFLLILFNIAKSAIASAKADENRGARVVLLVVFFDFLFLGLFDHYFISIHPSAMLFWIVAGLMSTKE